MRKLKNAEMLKCGDAEIEEMLRCWNAGMRELKRCGDAGIGNEVYAV